MRCLELCDTQANVIHVCVCMYIYIYIYEAIVTLVKSHGAKHSNMVSTLCPG
jgi:hypothetical protein